MSEQQTLGFDYDQPTRERSGQIVCLGITFENEEERRNYFTEKLREKLQDPEFRKIEGFPIGSDEDILALSDPPYYTACPNPWISDFIKEWESQKPEKPSDYKYHREPFAADVSEGKNDTIYNAHSYHTKVPHKAIMRYILHYTEPGDIVFDGFCGTGMTGVAAQMCGDRKTVESLGYQVQSDGTIMQQEADENGKTHWIPFSKLGVRRVVLNDLSSAATFIAYNYNTPVDVKAFEKEAKRILREVEKECGWMYETKHSDGQIGKINYTVWSDVFICPECAGEVVFWDVAVKVGDGIILDDFQCPNCNRWLSKSPTNPKKEELKPVDQRRPISSKAERSFISYFDSSINQIVKQAKQVPVLINYSMNGKRFEKVPDDFDFALIEKIENSDIPYWFPTDRMMEGKETRRNDPIGITHVHHFYTKRDTMVISSFLSKSERKTQRWMLKMVLTSLLIYASKLSRWRLANKSGPLAGTLYVSSTIMPLDAMTILPNRIKRLAKGKLSVPSLNSNYTTTSTNSSGFFGVLNNSIDYIFTDPPFGANLNYSELNFLWESWLKVVTNNKPEAIENSVQGKGPNEYRQLITACFKEAYRVLKPGHWMTVEFSNTKASVWNSIQTALNDAGFIIANVSALDKKQGSFKAVTTPTAVKQDLVISAYKPNGGFEKRFQEEATTEEGVWDFVRTHLDYLPVIKSKGALLEMVPERDPRILFDQMVAYYIRKGYFVPISSQEFQLGLSQRFIERDGMYFLPEQAAEYDRKRMMKQVFQAKLFVSDEASAIQWLRQLLKEKPQTFQDINPLFMQELGGWSKNEQQLDLRELLNQNFLCYDGKNKVPSQIHSYLSSNWPEMRNLAKDDPKLVAKGKDRWYVPDPNKVGDLEKLREKALLKEFDEYKQTKKKLKVFRLEAVRAGFKKAWQDRDYGTIIGVAEKIPNDVLESDQKLLMWYDQAVTRTGGE
jgi:DNA modification methylase